MSGKKNNHTECFTLNVKFINLKNNIAELIEIEVAVRYQDISKSINNKKTCYLLPVMTVIRIYFCYIKIIFFSFFQHFKFK